MLQTFRQNVFYAQQPFLSGRMALFAFFIALGFALLATPAHAAIRYVNKDFGSDIGTCSDSGIPCATIDHAISMAVAGDEIKVSKGTYLEAQILVDKAVIISGGFDPTGPTFWDTTNYTQTPTILDGRNILRPLYITSDDVTIQYMTIQNGNATSAIPPHQGGGILVYNAQNVKLQELKIINNRATNTIPGRGGGVAMFGNSSLTIDRTIIMSNSNPGLGGGIGVNVPAGETALLTVANSVIAHNAAGTAGAIGANGDGRTGLTLNNVTIAHNNTGPADAAIAMYAGSNVNGQQSSLDASQTLLIGNDIGFYSETLLPVNFGSVGFLMDDITDDFQGNHEATNPAKLRDLSFVNAAAGDYHLVALSPAIDVGSSGTRTDLDGRTRVNTANCTPLTLCPLGRLNDYGAYEYVNTVPVIRYVATTGSDDLSNCLNSATPCLTPENANKIALGGDEIRLAVGTYTDPDSTCINSNSAVICIRQGITLTGGFATNNWTTPSTDPLLTVLDGQDARIGIQVDYDVPSASSLVRNLTVRKGYTLLNGAGISIGAQNAGPAHNLTMRNCRVEESHVDAMGDGGGIYANDPVELRIENCTVNNNSVVDGRGGGIAVNDNNGDATYLLTNLTVYENVADRVNDASANGGVGGGVFLQGVGTFQQSEVYSNTAAFSGGGVTTGSNGAHPTLDRLYIHDNEAGLGGGFSIFLTGGANLQNSLLVRNSATSAVGLVTGQTAANPMFGGNAIHSPYFGVADEPLRVINVTVADNTGAVADAIKVEGLDDAANSKQNFFINVLLSGNAVGIRSNGKGLADLSNVMMINNVTTPTDGFDPLRLTGEQPLTGNLGFVGAGNYRLLPGADGVDDGVTVPGITNDLDGVARPVGSAFDIGAYETTLQKQNQTITFAEIPNRALSASPFTVQPIASSGLPVQLTSTTPTICTVNGYEVTLVAEGTCSLQAAQPGNATFNAATTVTRSFKIGIAVPQEILSLPLVVKKEPN